MTDYEDILVEKKDGIATITINRPKVLNAFRSQTVDEMIAALHEAGRDPHIGVAVITGTGDRAFCVGGDIHDKVPGGYGGASWCDTGIQSELLFRTIRSMPKPVIAAVNGYAIGGGNVLQVVCDLSIAADHSIFGQVGPRVGSFDAGFGTAYLARMVGERKAREIWFLCKKYSAEDALAMGLINEVVPKQKLMEVLNDWCKQILELSPTALKFLKYSFNADSEHINGISQLSFSALNLYCQSEEADEGGVAFKEKRAPRYQQYRQPLGEK